MAPRLALGELTNQLQASQLAIDKWAADTTARTSQARRQHLDKLSASQRARTPLLCVSFLRLS